MIRTILAFAIGLITGAVLILAVVFAMTVSAINKEADEEIKENYYGEG